MPIPFADLVDFLQLSLSHPVATMECIVQNHLPCNYLKYAILSQIEVILIKILEPLETNKAKVIVDCLDKLLYSEERRIWDSFLQHFMVQLSQIENLSAGYLIDILDKDHFNEGGAKTCLLEKCSTLPISKWKAQFRTKVYLQLVRIACQSSTYILSQCKYGTAEI